MERVMQRKNESFLARKSITLAFEEAKGRALDIGRVAGVSIEVGGRCGKFLRGLGAAAKLGAISDVEVERVESANYALQGTRELYQPRIGVLQRAIHTAMTLAKSAKADRTEMLGALADAVDFSAEEKAMLDALERVEYHARVFVEEAEAAIADSPLVEAEAAYTGLRSFFGNRVVRALRSDAPVIPPVAKEAEEVAQAHQAKLRAAAEATAERRRKTMKDRAVIRRNAEKRWAKVMAERAERASQAMAANAAGGDKVARRAKQRQAV